MMYTSGSTGNPKGVMVEHEGMINHVMGKLSDLGMTDIDALAQNGPQSFDIVVWQCLAPLVVGGCIVVFPDDVAEDPARLLEEVGKRGVTVLQMVPSMLQAVLDEASATGVPALTSLRWMVPTGEALPTDFCRRWMALYPHIPVLNTYGSTECSDDQCHYSLYALGAADQSVAIASIGAPISNMTAYVLGGNLAPVPVGVVGELYIGGLGVGRGYRDDPKRTATEFVPDPFSPYPGARMYRTRDMGRLRADGNLDFLGRIDHMIKLRGFRIEPGEIESALSEHPDISNAAVLAHAHPSGERRLVAYLATLANEELELDTDKVRAFLSNKLPQYMIPTVYIFLNNLPLTANGKLDQKRLPLPDWGAAGGEKLVAPSTSTEERLAHIWADALALERVGVNQDFFAIGGDSIRSIQIVARCNRAGVQISPSDIFQNPTIAELAVKADSNARIHVDSATDIDESASSELKVSEEHLALALKQVQFDSE